MTGVYNYLKLAASNTNYAKRMGRLSARIFGEVVRPTDKSSMRVVALFSKKPLDQRPEVVEYYPNHPLIYGMMTKLRDHGLYRDEHRDFQDEMKRLRKLRGKGPPKKGEGKKAKKAAAS